MISVTNSRSLLTGADTTGGVTVTGTEARRPSTSTTTVTCPGATALTTPPASTAATRGLLEDQLTGRSGSAVPRAPVTRAASASVPPTSSVPAAGVTLTAATGSGTTVKAAPPCTPSAIADTTALPTPTALTAPAASTCTTAVLLLRHRIARSNALPAASVATARAVARAPTTSESAAGDTRTVATAARTGCPVPGGAGTRTVANPVTPATDASTIAIPAATARTMPSDETVATPGSDDDHTADWPATTRPSPSSAARDNRTLAPIWSV